MFNRLAEVVWRRKVFEFAVIYKNKWLANGRKSIIVAMQFVAHYPVPKMLIALSNVERNL